MSEPETLYHTTPDGDAPPGGVVDLAGIIARNDAAFALHQAQTDRALLRITLVETQAEVARVTAERDAALRQVTALVQQVTDAESRCAALKAALNRSNRVAHEEIRGSLRRSRRE